MRSVAITLIFATVVVTCHAAPTSSQSEIVDWAPHLLKRGKLLEVRFHDGGKVYYEYTDHGQKSWISTVGSISGVSAVLVRELPQEIDAVTLESNVPQFFRVAFFNARLQVQLFDSGYARSCELTYPVTESYTINYLKRESIDPKAVIDGKTWKLRFRLIDEAEGARVEEWEISGVISPFELREAKVKLLPIDKSLHVEMHL